MERTSRKLRTLCTKVTEEQYQELLNRMDGEPPSEWLRKMLQEQLTTAPMLQVLLEELVALRYIQESFMHDIATERQVTVQSTKDLIATADRKKFALAAAARGNQHA
jgi:hypothetical protein